MARPVVPPARVIAPLFAVILIAVTLVAVPEAMAPAGAGAATTRSQSRLADTVAGCPRTLWQAGDTPAVAAIGSSAAVEIGVKFRADRDGYVTGVRFYKGPGNTGTHLGRLWSAGGEKLAEATFTGESGSGWQRVRFTAPIRIAAGTTYVASYFAPVGHYAYTYDYFAAADRVRSPLTALRDGAQGGNGVYRVGAGFPNATYRSLNYWVDVIFDPTAAEACPATIWEDTHAPALASSSSSVELGVKFRVDRDGYLHGIRFFKGPGNTGTHIGRLWSRTGQKLAEATFVAESPSGWQQAWFAQPVAVSAGVTYVASYLAPNGHYAFGEFAFATAGVARGPLRALRDGEDGGNGVFVYGTGGFPTGTFHAADYGVDVLFTTSQAACSCSIWPSTAVPAVPASTDVRTTELGVRFRPLRNGFVTGIRFYKGVGNAGSHVGRLWSAAGGQLAQVNFTDESAGGWQQARFATPVPVAAGTTYVASYLAPQGRYAFAESSFAAGHTVRGPLAALADGFAGLNGVFRYGGGFPTSSFRSSNYWVDVIFDSSATDTTAPVVVAQWPEPDGAAVAVATTIAASFNEPVLGASVAISVETESGAGVPGTVSYDSASRTAEFTPAVALAHLTDYVVRVSGARDSAGNTMQPLTWTFTTGIDPLTGPGGPVGVITSPTNPYSGYYAEILRAEGLNLFTTLPLEALSAAALAPLQVVILADLALTADQVATLTSWVSGGGRLIAMSPDPMLAPLLGLTPTGGTLTDGYLLIDQATAPGSGITDTTMQFHGRADRYTLAGATMIARLYASATSATNNPAVTLRTSGTGAGAVAAFTYDLARSVALTRQGNPAWAGQERDGSAPIRSNDLFFGGSEPDWVDLSKVAIPQADEQQRLLVNLIEHLSRDRMPLPRFWYLPSGHKAVVASTGDDEKPGTHGTAGRFDRYLANSAPGCQVADWQCLRFTSYVWPSVGLTDAQARAYHAQGFEVALHPQNGCANYTPASLEASYATQLADWGEKYPSIQPPVTSRYHCVSYSDWDSQPKTELRHGIRFDANYYYWPGGWIQDRPGFMTGSAIPMRFTDTAGRTIDVFQGATVMTDESLQSYPHTSNTLLDSALGPTGYYGVFVANMHSSNQPSSFEDDQLVASAQNRGVPVVTAREVLRWLDAKDSSSFAGLSWSAGALTFTVSAARTARGLTALLPTTGVGGTTLSTLTRAGSPVPVNRITIKGIEYAMFAAASGPYTATYTVAAASVSAATVTATTEDSATLRWSSGVPGSTEIVYGTSPSALNRTVVAETSRQHAVTLTGLAPATTYYYRVSSRDARSRHLAWPGPAAFASFTTAPADRAAPLVSDLRVAPLPDGTVRVTWRTNEPATSAVAFGAAPDRLDRHARDLALVSSHVVVLTNLEANRTLHLRIVSADASANATMFPAAAAAPTRFVTAPAGVADQTRVGFRTGRPSGSLIVTGTGLAVLTLATPAPPEGGAFESRVLDAFASVGWHDARWEAQVPAGAMLRVSVRTGDAPEPDPSWSSWTAVAGPGARLAVPDGRYLQYRVELAPGVSGVPVLHWIGFTHDGPLPGAQRRTGAAPA